MEISVHYLLPGFITLHFCVKMILSAETYLIVAHLPDKTNKASILFHPNYEDLITSGKGSISKMTFPSTTYLTRISSFPVNDTLFLYDMYTKFVYKMTGIKSLSLKTSALHYGISSSPASSIAFDWVRGNVYSTDGKFGWITIIPYTENDPTMFVIIHQHNMFEPRAIAVDPIAGFIFWFDTMIGTPRIEISKLSGEDRRVLIHSGLKSVYGLVADNAKNKIYWADEDRYSVEESSYDGTGRRIIYRENNVPFTSLTMSKDHLCFGYLKGAGCMRKATGIITYLKIYEQYVSAVDIFDETLQPSKKDECGSKCDHICVNDPDGPKCLCKEGYTLHQNGTSCTPHHIFEGIGLFILNDTQACIFGIRALAGKSEPLNCMVDDLKKAVHVAMDSLNYVLYYGESTSTRIKSFNIITSKTEIVAVTGAAGKVSGLAYDWIAKLLYWTESDSGRVKYVDVETKSVATLVTTIQPAYHVTLDPYNRMVFWIKGVPNFPNSIESIVSDGKSSRKTVIGVADVKSITGLYYDQRSKRLYWINDGSLYSATSNGTDVKKHVPVGTGLNTLLLIYKEYVIWSHDNSPVKVSDITTVSQTTLLSNQFSSVNGITVYDPTLQKPQQSPCDVMNGDCEQICIPTTNVTRICKCDFGFFLHSDGISCNSNVLSDNFILTQDLVHGRLHQVSLDGTKIVSLDIPIVNRPGDVVWNDELKHIYWTETDTRQIMSATLQGSDVTSLIKFENEYPDRIAIDYTTSLIYYTTTSLASNGKGSIGVLHPTENIKRTLVSQTQVYRFVTGICLHSEKGWIFWASTSDSNEAVIARASMDGSLVKVVVPTGLDKPRGLTIDYTASKLYWTTNAGIYFSDLEGNSMENLIEEKQELSDVFVMSPYIYYVGRRDPKITKAKISPFKRESWMLSQADIGIMLTIDFYPTSNQKDNSACAVNNGDCSLFCLPTSYGRKCACGEGVPLQADEKTCSGVKLCKKTVPRGSLSKSCLARQDTKCSYSCDAGLVVAYSSVKCDSSGSWEHELSKWCQDAESGANYALIGGIAAGGVLVIVVLIVAIVICRKRRKAPKQKGKQMTSQVFFTQQGGQHPNQSTNNTNRLSNSSGVGPPVFGSSKVEEEVYDEIPDSSYETLERQNGTASVYSKPEDDHNVTREYVEPYSQGYGYVDPVGKNHQQETRKTNYNYYEKKNDYLTAQPGNPYVTLLP